MRRNIVGLFAIVSVITFSQCSSQKAITKTNTPNPNAIELPEPSQSHRKSSKVIGWPADKLPVAPEGFVVTKFADKSNKLDNPRWIYVTPNGDILVSQSRTNKNTSPNNIIIFRDADKDGKWEVNEVFMSNLKQPLGMLVHGNYFYVGHTDGIFRYPYTPGQLSIFFISLFFVGTIIFSSPSAALHIAI